MAASLPIRERLAEHRTNAACASCHRLIDPVGFSLEQFDAVGRWRTLDEGKPVDAAGGLPDGSEFKDVAGLEKALLKRPELFVRTLIEKLFIFVLGRAPDESDAPAIRKIVSAIPEKRQTLFFSATMAGEIEHIAMSIVKDPTFIEISKRGTTAFPPSSTAAARCLLGRCGARTAASTTCSRRSSTRRQTSF